MNSSTTVEVITDAHMEKGSISEILQPPKFATQGRTRLTVTVYEPPAVFDPPVHGVLYYVESWKPPMLMWGLFPRTVDNELEIVRCNGGGGGQGSEPCEFLERCLHIYWSDSKQRTRGWGRVWYVVVGACARRDLFPAHFGRHREQTYACTNII